MGMGMVKQDMKNEMKKKVSYRWLNYQRIIKEKGFMFSSSYKTRTDSPLTYAQYQ